ncbi:MAG TPA: RNA polymerase sigma factor [Acidimicrobiia bacterium]
MRAPLDAHLQAHDDDALLARLRAGDDVAFGALVDRHRPWLVRFCTRMLGYDAHAGEDAAQESLLKLHAAARRDGRPLRVRPWLTVVARNTCVDEQRRRRPDLPGVLPERAAPGEDPFLADAALTAAWEHLSGRHREVLYLREVLGFSYKEIGSVMDLTLPAVETLVFRARAALRREYERSGGPAASFGLLGLRLARLGLGRRRDGAAADNVANAVAGDGGATGLGTRLAQWVSSIPGCGEPAVAKVLSAAAGLTVAAAAVFPGLGPLATTPPAVAAAPAPVAGPAAPAITVAALGVPVGSSAGPMAPTTGSTGLKGLLGNAVPADWAPHRTRGTAAAPAPTSPAPTGGTDSRPRITPLRDAAAARPDDGPQLRQPVAGEAAGPTPVRSLLAEGSGPVSPPERPTHPVRSLLADPWPLPLGPVPSTPIAGTPPGVIPSDPVPSPPVGAGPGLLQGAVTAVQDEPLATVASDDPALLRRGDG